jgi:hypothetical protein
MADYGFATYNARTRRKSGEVNSKYPIFGPEYNKISTQFKTYHLRDAHTQEIRTSSISLPPVGADGDVTINEYHAFVKYLVKRIPHGGNGKIPLGYITMNGNIVKNTKSNIVFDKEKDLAPLFCPEFNYNANNVRLFPAMSAAGESLRDMSSGSSGYTGFSQNYVPYPNFPDLYPKQMSGYLGQVIPGNNSSTSDADYTERYPYSIEVDGEYIYIYGYTYWCDIWTRMCYGDGDFADVRTRTRAALDYAGTTMDFTLYLCPYSMEDLT